VLGVGFEHGALALRGVGDAEQSPDEARGQHDGFRLVQLDGGLDRHEAIGDEEDQERQIADGVPRQVDAGGGFLRMSGDDEQRENDGGQE